MDISTIRASNRIVYFGYLKGTADGDYGNQTSDAVKKLQAAYGLEMTGDISSIEIALLLAEAETVEGYIDSSEKSGQSLSRSEPEDEADYIGTDYIINVRTGKFHYPWCYSVDRMNEENKKTYNGTRDELIAKGYSPCGNCHP